MLTPFSLQHTNILLLFILSYTAYVIPAASSCQDDAVSDNITLSKDKFMTIMKEHGSTGTIALLQNIHTTEESKIVIRDEISRWNEGFRSFPKHYENLSPLLCALHNQELEIALSIIRTFPRYLRTTDSRGNTALHYYCKSKCMQPEEEISVLDRTLISMMQPLLNVPNQARSPLSPSGVYPVALGKNYHLLIALGLQGADINRITMAGRQFWSKHITQILDIFMYSKKKPQNKSIYKEIQGILRNETMHLFGHEAGKGSIVHALRAREEGSMRRGQLRHNYARSKYFS